MTRRTLPLIASLLAIATSPALAAPSPATTQSSPRAISASRQLLFQNVSDLEEADVIAVYGHVKSFGSEKLGPAMSMVKPDWCNVGRVVGSGAMNLDIQVDLTRDNQSLFGGSASTKRSAPPVAAEIADDAVAFVRRYLTDRENSQRVEAMKRRQRDVDLAQRAFADADNKLKAMRQNLRDMSGRADVSPATLTAALSQMDQQLQLLQLERLSKDSRRSAIEEELAKVADRVQKSVNDDVIATELKKVVAAREERMSTMKKMFEAGQSSQAEMSESIAAVAEARAKVLQQQRDAAAAAGGNILEKLNGELIALSIDSRELDAKIKFLEERLKGLRASVELLDEFRAADEEASRTSAVLRDTTDDLNKISRMIEDRPAARVLVRNSQDTLAD